MVLMRLGLESMILMKDGSRINGIDEDGLESMILMRMDLESKGP